MDGLEQRIAMLKAAGWEFRKDYGPYQVWAAYMPNGQVYFVEFSEARVLEGCPAVESSVDAALQYLILPRYHQWELYPLQSPPHLVDQDYSIATIYNLLSGEQVATSQHESLSAAMCEAFLKLQRG